MKTNRFLIDGRFLASMSTGVDRYAYQILRELDQICVGMDLAILVPANAKEVPDYKNIRVIQSKQSRFWTQFVFGIHALFSGAIPVNLCNEVSILARKGIVCLHDVCYAETVDQFPFINEIPQDERNWFLKIYKRIVKKAAVIITVTEFSKSRICDLLGVEADRITVIGNGWQHFKDIKPDEAKINQFPAIKEGQYYFTLSSSNKNKNLDWILKAAEYNPEEHFVVSGKNIDQIIDFTKYPNITYVGFASDEFAKALMTHCKAFIFPSYYEGFGIPPLEALSTGARVVISRSASLPELFGSAAHYIDPQKPEVIINDILAQPVSDGTCVLEKYSWKNAAVQLLQLLQHF